MEHIIEKVVYMAHPLGDGENRLSNLHNAAQWLGYLSDKFTVAVSASWIVLARVWPEVRRDLGLAIDTAIVRKCDELWLVGGRISEGMAIEKSVAEACGIPVLDLTCCGYDLPTDPAKIAAIVGENLLRLRT